MASASSGNNNNGNLPKVQTRKSMGGGQVAPNASLHPELTLPEWIQLMDDDPIVLSVILTSDEDPSLAGRSNTSNLGVSSSTSSGEKNKKKEKKKEGDSFEVRASSRLMGSFFSNRSYDEFVLLHDVLAAKFPGCCLPPIPKLKPILVTLAPAALGGKTKQEKKMFSHRQAHLLQLFLQAIADHPFLRNDDGFIRFVQDSEEFDPFGFDPRARSQSASSSKNEEKQKMAEKAARIRARSVKLKKEVAIIKRSSIKQPVARRSMKVGESAGSIRWKEALEEAGRHMNFEHATEELKLEHEELGDHINVLNALKIAAKAQVDMCKKSAETAMILASAMEGWATRARTEAAVHVDGSRVELRSELMDCSQRTMQHAVVLDKEWGAIQIEHALLNTVRFEKHLCIRWRQQVENALNKSQERKKAQEVVNKMQAEIGTALEKGEPQEKIANLGKKLADAKAILKDVEEQALDYERGLLGWELDRYRKMRALRAERIREELMRLHVRGAKKVLSIWDVNATPSALTYTLGSPGESESGAAKAGSKTTDLAKKKNGLFSRSSFLMRLAFGAPPPKEKIEIQQRGVKGLENAYTKKDNEHKDSDEHSPAAPPGAMAKKKAPIENDKNKVTLLAKHDYEAKRDDELNLHEGEQLTAVRVDEDLWFATNSFGVCGVVPSKDVYVPDTAEDDVPINALTTPRQSNVGSPINHGPRPSVGFSAVRSVADSRLSISSDGVMTPPPPPPGIVVSAEEALSRARILSLPKPIAPMAPGFLAKPHGLSSASDDDDELA